MYLQWLDFWPQVKGEKKDIPVSWNIWLKKQSPTTK